MPRRLRSSLPQWHSATAAAVQSLACLLYVGLPESGLQLYAQQKSTMLAARKLPDVLRTALSDGVEGCCLMTAEGSSLCVVLTSDSVLTETSLAAISSSIYNNYVQCAPDISLHLMQLEYGCIAITSASKGYVLSAYGRNASVGLLKARLEALGVYFQRVFEQLE